MGRYNMNIVTGHLTNQPKNSVRLLQPVEYLKPGPKLVGLKSKVQDVSKDEDSNWFDQMLNHLKLKSHSRHKKTPHSIAKSKEKIQFQSNLRPDSPLGMTETRESMYSKHNPATRASRSHPKKFIFEDAIADLEDEPRVNNLPLLTDRDERISERLSISGVRPSFGPNFYSRR